MNSRGSRSKLFQVLHWDFGCVYSGCNQRRALWEILGSTMDEGSNDLSRLSIEDMGNTEDRGRGQPTTDAKKRRSCSGRRTARVATPPHTRFWVLWRPARAAHLPHARLRGFPKSSTRAPLLGLACGLFSFSFLFWILLGWAHYGIRLILFYLLLSFLG